MIDKYISATKIKLYKYNSLVYSNAIRGTPCENVMINEHKHFTHGTRQHLKNNISPLWWGYKFNAAAF